MAARLPVGSQAWVGLWAHSPLVAELAELVVGSQIVAGSPLMAESAESAELVVVGSRVAAPDSTGRGMCRARRGQPVRPPTRQRRWRGV